MKTFQILIVEEPSSEPKETRPANLVALKTGASTLRDNIMQAEKEEEWRGRGRGGAKNIEKLRRNLAELEAQLVLASPHLLFQVLIHLLCNFSKFMSQEIDFKKIPRSLSQTTDFQLVSNIEK